MADLEGPSTPPPLFPCSICNRTFLQESLAKHYASCEKNASKKRKIFDSTKQRVQGTDLAEYLPVIIKTKKAEKAPEKKPLSKWKEQHLEFVRAIRAARGVNDGETEQEPAMTAITRPSNHEQCPTCERHFGPKAYDRHIEWCREKQARLPHKPNVSTEAVMAKERLDARTKYRAPPLNKSRREITKEKYSVTRSGGGDTSTCVKKDQPQTAMPQISHARGSRSIMDPTTSPKETVSASSFQRTPHRSSYRQSSASPVKRPNVPPHTVAPKEPRVVRSRGVSPQKGRRDVKEFPTANKTPVKNEKEFPSKGRKASKGDEISGSISVKGMQSHQSKASTPLKKTEGLNNREMAKLTDSLMVSDTEDGEIVPEEDKKLHKEAEYFKSQIPVPEVHCSKTTYDNTYFNANAKIDVNILSTYKLNPPSLQNIRTLPIKRKAKVRPRILAFPLKPINVSEEPCDSSNNNTRPFNEKLRRDIIGKRNVTNLSLPSSQGNSPRLGFCKKRASDTALIATHTGGSLDGISLCEDFTLNASDSSTVAVDRMSRTYTISNSEISSRSVNASSPRCMELSLEDLVSGLTPSRTSEYGISSRPVSVVLTSPIQETAKLGTEDAGSIDEDFLYKLDLDCATSTPVTDKAVSREASRELDSACNDEVLLGDNVFKDWKAPGDIQNRCVSKFTMKNNCSNEEADSDGKESEYVVVEEELVLARLTVPSVRSVGPLELSGMSSKPCSSGGVDTSEKKDSEEKSKSVCKDEDLTDDKVSDVTAGSSTSIQISLEDIDENTSQESESVIYDDYNLDKHKVGDIALSLAGSCSSYCASLIDLLKDESESDTLENSGEYDETMKLRIIRAKSSTVSPKHLNAPQKQDEIPAELKEKCTDIDQSEQEVTNLQCVPMSTSTSEETLSGDSLSSSEFLEEEISPSFKPILRYWGSNVDLSFEENKASMLPRLAYFKELKLKTFGRKPDEMDGLVNQNLRVVPEDKVTMLPPEDRGDAKIRKINNCNLLHLQAKIISGSTRSRDSYGNSVERDSSILSDEETDWFSSDNNWTEESDDMVEIVTVTRIDDGSKVDTQQFPKKVLRLPRIENNIDIRYEARPEKAPSEKEPLVLPPINASVTPRALAFQINGTQETQSARNLMLRSTNSNRSSFWLEQVKASEKNYETKYERNKPRPSTRILKTQQENSNFWMKQALLIKKKESDMLNCDFESYSSAESPQLSLLGCQLRDSHLCRLATTVTSSRSYKLPRRKYPESKSHRGQRTSRSLGSMNSLNQTQTNYLEEERSATVKKKMEDLQRFRSKPRYSEEDEFSSADSVVNNQQGKCNPDSAYSSLNRKSPAPNTHGNPLDLCDRTIQAERMRLSSSGSDSSEQLVPPIPVGTVQGMRQDYMSPSLKQNYSPRLQDITSPQQSVQKMSKFCHECGSKFPLTVAKFCCECGVKRLVV